MQTLLTVFRKEVLDNFRDRRTMLTTGNELDHVVLMKLDHMPGAARGVGWLPGKERST